MEQKKHNPQYWLHGKAISVPEERFTVAKQIRVATFTLVTNNKGEDRFVDVTLFGDHAIDVALLIQDKGTPVSVYGEFSKKEADNGKTYYKLTGRHINVPSNVLFAALRSAATAAPQNTYAATDQQPALGEEDDDIPF